MIVCAVVAFGMALIAVSTRGLKEMDVSLIQFYYGLVSSLMIGIYMLGSSISTGVIPFSDVSLATWIELIAASAFNIVA